MIARGERERERLCCSRLSGQAPLLDRVLLHRAIVALFRFLPSSPPSPLLKHVF